MGVIPSIPVDYVSEALGYARQLREEQRVAPVQLVQHNVQINVQALQDDPDALARERMLVQTAAIQLQQREHALENAANQYESALQARVQEVTTMELVSQEEVQQWARTTQEGFVRDAQSYAQRCNEEVQ
jgi:hypothetical protein